MPATLVTIVDFGDGRKAIRHLDPDCVELSGIDPALLLGRMAATATVRALTVRCPVCFVETERREAEERDRRARRASGVTPPRAAPRCDETADEVVPVAAPMRRADRLSSGAGRHLVQIARCSHLARCLDDVAPAHPCATILLNQWAGRPHEERRERWREAHQLPEPWNGHLESAPILFLSSNPSISGSVDSRRPSEFDLDPPTLFMGKTVDEHPSIRRLGQGPKWTWRDDEIIDRYESAFDLYIADGVAGRLPDGSRVPSTRFWIEVCSRAAELLPGSRPVPGVDYALTEAVRCKSRHEIGVEEALDTCSSLYLRETVERSGAAVVVVLGRRAARAVEKQFSLSAAERLHERVPIGRRLRAVAFLPHPNARSTRSFATTIGEEGLRRLRHVVAEACARTEMSAE